MDRFNTFKLFFEEHKNKIIIGILFIIILLFSTLFFLNIDRKVKIKTDDIVISSSNLEDDLKPISNELNNNDVYIYVDIKGEVNSPGVYSIENGKRVVDAINLAGGLKDNSDTTLINLSTKLTDQMVIVVYSKDEINNRESLKQEINDKSKICNEVVKNDACIINNIESVVIPDLVEKNDNTKEIKNNETIDYKININTGSLSELKTIPKIGDIKANAIISYRKENGNFKTIDEIKNVKGIGDTLFENIKEYITI